MHYRRMHVPGASYFFTVVTHERRPIFADAQAVRLLNAAIGRVREKRPFTIEAQVILPDHLHAIWSLPDGDCDFPTRCARSRRRSLAAGPHARPMAAGCRLAMPAAARALQQALERIRTCVALDARQSEPFAAWLKDRG